MNDHEFYGEAYEVMKQTERRLQQLIQLYETEKEKEHDLKPIIYICSRIKSPDSVLDKLRRKGYEQSPQEALHQLYDTVGIRAVCAFAEDVYCLVKWLRDRGEIRIVEEKDYYAKPKPNGYRSYHVLLEMADGPEKGYRAEIQIWTIANDFWAALEHRLKYKKDIPHEKVIQEELKRCAFEISSVDASMQAIRDLLKKDEQ